jgi:hypothetical protein
MLEKWPKTDVDFVNKLSLFLRKNILYSCA